MTANLKIDFNDPLWLIHRLDTALEKEQEKYKKCPVIRDMAPNHETAQGWGYVVVGYFLLEQALKALLHVRGKPVSKIHSLSDLFDRIGQEDREVLRECYTDFKMTIGGDTGQFPFKSLDDFLINLDGDKNDRGNYIGSFVWRYFLIEEKRSQAMPLVSVEYLHEIVYACIRIIECANNDHVAPAQHTRSWRMFQERREKYGNWLSVRMNFDGWADFGDRLEILWGPDYLKRHDLCFFEGNKMKFCFLEIPTDSKVPIVDKRKEITDILGII